MLSPNEQHDAAKVQTTLCKSKSERTSVDIDRLLTATKDFECFKDHSKDRMKMVLSAMTVVVLGEAEVCVSQGDVADAFFIVFEGLINVDVSGSIVMALTRGMGFGHLGLFDGTPRSATCLSAHERTVLFKLPKDDYVSGPARRPRCRRRAVGSDRARPCMLLTVPCRPLPGAGARTRASTLGSGAPRCCGRVVSRRPTSPSLSAKTHTQALIYNSGEKQNELLQIMNFMKQNDFFRKVRSLCAHVLHPPGCQLMCCFAIPPLFLLAPPPPPTTD